MHYMYTVYIMLGHPKTLGGPEDTLVNPQGQTSKFHQMALGIAQHAEWILNKIENTFNGTFMWWKSMHQGLRIYFVLNPRLMAIETAC